MLLYPAVRGSTAGGPKCASVLRCRRRDVGRPGGAAARQDARGAAQVELPFDPDRLGLSLPAIIVPDPYLRQQPIKFGQGHPLDGVIVHQVSDVLARVRSLNRENLRDTEALLRLCADDRFVLSAKSRVTATP